MYHVHSLIEINSMKTQIRQRRKIYAILFKLFPLMHYLCGGRRIPVVLMPNFWTWIDLCILRGYDDNLPNLYRVPLHLKVVYINL